MSRAGWWRPDAEERAARELQEKQALAEQKERTGPIRANKDGTFSVDLPNGCRWTFKAPDLREAKRIVDSWIKQYQKRYPIGVGRRIMGGTSLNRLLNKRRTPNGTTARAD